MAELTSATQQCRTRWLDGIRMQRARHHLGPQQVSGVPSAKLSRHHPKLENITRASQGYVEQMQEPPPQHRRTEHHLQRNGSPKGVSSQHDSIGRVNRELKDIRDMYEKARHKGSLLRGTEKMFATCNSSARYTKDDHSHDHQAYTVGNAVGSFGIPYL